MWVSHQPRSGLAELLLTFYCIDLLLLDVLRGGAGRSLFRNTTSNLPWLISVFVSCPMTSTHMPQNLRSLPATSGARLPSFLGRPSFSAPGNVRRFRGWL